MTKFLFILFFNLCSVFAYSQITAMYTGTLSDCGGTIADDGLGGPYTNANYTLTICPDVPGDVIQLDFSAFALQTSPGANNNDFLAIYDGPNTSSPSLGDYTGSSLQGLQVTGTVNNPTGCLTLVFADNGPANSTSPGFEAAVSCTTPCAPPTQNSVIANPLPVGPDQSIAICVGTSVEFNGIGSFAEPGFTLAQYLWDFDEGPVDNVSGQTASHVFNEPGEYVVTLTVEDNNGCQSLNSTPLQVLVSTSPTFPELNNITQSTCFGETVTLTGSAQSTQWTALPPQVVSGSTYLADGAGFSYSSTINFDFFEPGALLMSCSDLYGVMVNMEHSYMGDLGISISCPNGTSVDLVTWGTNGGGGTFLGQPIDEFPETTDPGIGWDYNWAPNATNGTWGVAQAAGLTTEVTTPTAGFSLNPGTYAAQENLCDLVGCPLNGSWTFTITDNLGADNGYIFEWGLNLNPSLFPGITTFTPSIGGNADSSYWTGPNIVNIDTDADIATIFPPGPGTYDYTYHVVNNFGCSFDSTIQITFTEPLVVTAGPDQVYSCGDLILQGSFVGVPPPSCVNEGGVFNYCYDNNENFTWTFCPDVQNDGVSFMTFDFISGQMEGFFETFNVYDGPDATYPQIGNWTTGDATGQSWTATNPSGCITVTFDSDGSFACADGSTQPWTYDINCTSGGPQYTWEWTPSAVLNNPNTQQPIISSLSQQTTFTLVGYPVGFPDCASTDECIVSIDPVGDPGVDNSINICSTDPAFQMLPLLGGTPVTTGVWTDPTNAPVLSGIFDPLTMPAGAYTYTVTLGVCSLFSTLNISFSGPTTMTIANDTSICYMGDLNLDQLTQASGQAPFTYEWTYNGTVVANTPDAVINPTVSGQACLTVVDDCGYSITQCFNVLVTPDVTVTFTTPEPSKCWPETLSLINTTDPSSYQNMSWEISDGQSITNQNQVNLNFVDPGSYDVTLTVVTNIGCTYSTTIPNFLTSFDPPVAGYIADPQPTDANNTVINFTDQTLGNIVSYDWIFNVGAPLGNSTSQSPTFTFPQGTGGEYPIRLTVTDINGCTDFVEGEIIIRNIFQYYLPNSFTPNNDGLNDVIMMVGTDIDETQFKLEIFNRWGQIVFSTTDPETSWTGNAFNGDYYCPEGAYNWTGIVISKTTGERYEIQGYLNLIR
jgi:gliding motility-associated-like protein